MKDHLGKILVVEDEEDIRDLIHFTLFKENYEVKVSEGGNEAISLYKDFEPDVLLLDIMMPDKSGLEILEEINEIDPEVACIFVTAKDDEMDQVKGLEIGADDYITKPFSPKVLAARVNSLIRRKKSKSKDISEICLEGLTLNLTTRKFFIEECEVELTFSEFEILHLLMGSPGVAFKRSDIVDLIRGTNHAISDRSVDVQFVGIRKKLGAYGELIETVRGVGYRLKK